MRTEQQRAREAAKCTEELREDAADAKEALAKLESGLALERQKATRQLEEGKAELADLTLRLQNAEERCRQEAETRRAAEEEAPKPNPNPNPNPNPDPDPDPDPNWKVGRLQARVKELTAGTDHAVYARIKLEDAGLEDVPHRDS